MRALMLPPESADEHNMRDQRRNSRVLCAELVEIKYQDLRGQERYEVGNLDDISVHGACLQMEYALPIDTPVLIGYDGGQFSGKVRYCAHRDGNHFVGIEFNPNSLWNKDEFEPEHLFDPKKLFEETLARYDKHRLKGDVV